MQIKIHLFLLLASGTAFSPLFRRTRSSRLLAGKPDLFSDDLFEDDENKNQPVTKKEATPKQRNYIDEKWQLSSEDEKDFKGFPGQKTDGPVGAFPVSANATDLPVYALLYKFRREYLDTSVDAVMADHRGYCGKFKRILSSELINLGKSKGVVLLWAGYTDRDKVATKAEITSFLENDPLLVQDVIEVWDLIDLADRNGASTELAGVVGAGAAR